MRFNKFYTPVGSQQPNIIYNVLFYNTGRFHNLRGGLQRERERDTIWFIFYSGVRNFQALCPADRKLYTSVYIFVLYFSSPREDPRNNNNNITCTPAAHRTRIYSSCVRARFSCTSTRQHPWPAAAAGR